MIHDKKLKTKPTTNPMRFFQADRGVYLKPELVNDIIDYLTTRSFAHPRGDDASELLDRLKLSFSSDIAKTIGDTLDRHHHASDEVKADALRIAIGDLACR